MNFLHHCVFDKQPALRAALLPPEPTTDKNVSTATVTNTTVEGRPKSDTKPHAVKSLSEPQRRPVVVENPPVQVSRQVLKGGTPELGRLPAVPQPKCLPPPTAMEKSVADADNFEAMLPRKTFFFEWRITSAPLIHALGEAQKELQEIAATQCGGSGLEVRQSCALDNLHVTLNEFQLSTHDELKRVRTVITEWQRSKALEVMRACGSPPSIALEGVTTFRSKVAFAAISGTGADLLQHLYDGLRESLVAVGINCGPNRALVPHITLGKAAKSFSALPQPILNHLDRISNTKFGHEPLHEIVFCAKRAPMESVPPVLARIHLQKQ